MSSIDYLNLCRLCLVKESAFVPIFDGEGDGRQISLKIAACLPVKVTRDDKLPKKICNECVQKIELFYQFCNTTTNAEKQLLEWIGGVDLNDKQTYVSAVINQDQSSNNRLDGNVMQQTNEQHQNNIDMNMMESIGLEMPMMIQQNQTQMTINYTNNTNAQSMQSNTVAQQQNNSKNMEESDDDHCGGDDDMGQNEELSVKEEIQDSNRTIEPTFVSVSSPCEEAGPSGLQQKSGDIPDGQFLAGQSTDGDPKSGSVRKVLSSTKEDKSKVNGSLQKLQKPVITKPPNQASVIIYLPENITSNTGGSPVKVVDITKLINQKKLRLVNIKSLNINNPSKINNTPNIIKKETIINCHECSTCKKTFPSPKLLKTHLVTHSDARPYKCKVCDKTFKRSCTLAIHNKIHAKERKYICEVCQRAFIQKAALEVHRRRHFENFTLHCEHCNKGFVTKAEHHAHMNVKHGAREHVCTTCQNSYPNNHSLVRHMKKHDPNYKPLLYNCNDCDKSFLSKRSLIAHIGNHTGQRKKFKCDICGKYISSNASLQDHLRLHRGDKPYVCDVCGHTFHKRGTLVTHQRTHTGERPYSCDICNKSFTQRSSLVIHKRYHTGERPYECSYCEKNFVSRALLNGHAKVHR